MAAHVLGLRRRTIMWKVLARNSLIPLVTVIGLQIGYTLGGVILVEEVFNLPGLGTLLWNSVTERDYFVIQGVMLLAVAIFAVVNFLVDVSYGLLDPKSGRTGIVVRVPLGRRVLDKLTYLFPPHDVSLRMGAFLLFVIVVVALFAPVIAPYGPDVIHSNAPLLGPSSRYLLGTDELGRDVLSRVIYGTQSSLEIGFAAATVSAVVGVPLGLLSGYREGAVSTMVMRVTDVLLGFPGLVIVMVVSLVFHEDLGGRGRRDWPIIVTQFCPSGP